MLTKGRRWISHWLPLPITILHLGTLASISSLGPIIGSTLAISCLFFVACIASSAGFAVAMIAISQLSDLPGLSEASVFALKWAVSVVMLGVIVARYSIERRSVDLRLRTPERILVLFALWCCICSLFSIHKLASFAEALRIAVYPVLVVIVRETLTSRRHLVMAVLGYALAAVMGTAYSASGMSGGLGRFAGFSGNANSFGLFLSFTVPVLVAAWFACRGFFLRAVLQVSASLSVAALLMSWSRASLLSIVVQGIVVSLLFRKIKLILAGAVLGVTLLTIVLLTPNARNLVFTALRLQSGATHRTIIWNAGVESALQSPVVGHGFGLRVGEVVQQVRWGNWGESLVFKSPEAPFYPHNLYIFLALSAGIPGLALFLMMVWTLCRRHLIAGRTAADHGLRIANYTIVAMIVGALFNGLFEGAALVGKGAINNYFWIAVGIVAAYTRIVQTEEKNRGATLS